MVVSAVAKISILSSADKVHWDDLYQNLSAELQDVNFSFDYNFIYEQNGDGSIRLFVFQKSDSMYLYPFLIRKVFSAGKETEFNDIETVYGYTGPISTDTNSEFLAEADEAFRNYCSDEKIITEFIRYNPLLQNQEISRSANSVSLIALRDYIAVDLSSSSEEIFANYSSQNRNKIRKAEKAGVQIEFDSQCNRFEDFKSIYLENMKRLNAAPMYFFSEGFFTGLKKLALESGVLVNAIFEERVIGSTVFLKGKMFGHYFLSSATEEGKKWAVSNFMLHQGIQWAKENSLKSIHLGGGVTAEETDPLLVFKKNFSNKVVKFYIGKRIHDEKAYKQIVDAWDEQHPVEAMKYKFILQRYRLKEQDLV